MVSDQEYKDRVRHGGKREILLDKFGPACSMCGEKTEPRKIAAHHLKDKMDHEFQVLLCLSCHAKLHGGTERKVVSPEELQEAIESSSTLNEAQNKLGLSKHGFYYKREKYGLLNKECPECKKVYRPSPGLHQYCSDDCADKAGKKKLQERTEKYRGKKREGDKRYYQRNKERLIAYQKRYYEQNKEKVLAYHKQLYDNKRAGVL